jgi:hypothetical protein
LNDASSFSDSPADRRKKNPKTELPGHKTERTAKIARQPGIRPSLPSESAPENPGQDKGFQIIMTIQA